MKVSHKTKYQLKTSAKILLTMIGVNAALSLGIIIAALKSDRPEYDKSAHREAKLAYAQACDDYSTTYNVARDDAKSAVHMDNKNGPLMWEIVTTEVKMENCTDDVKYDILDARLDSLNYELDDRISDKMSAHQGLIAATDTMAKALMVMRKYDRDSAIRADWAAQPIDQRIVSGLKKIFLNGHQRMDRIHRKLLQEAQQKSNH